MALTAKHVEQVLRAIPGAYGRQVTSLAVLASGADAALSTAPEGLTVKGAAAFLATMAQESASFRVTEEYAKNGRYAPFIGRTFEMVTWKDNYAAFGKWCSERGLLSDPDTFVDSPKKLAEIRWAWLGGVWFWRKNGIWAYGNRGDFLATQRAVNLGNPTSSATPNGISARRAWYDAWLKIGDDLLPTTEEVPVKLAPRHGKALAAYARGRVGDSYGIAWCQKFTNECGQTGSVGDYDGDAAADAEDGWKKAVANGRVVKAADVKYDQIPPGVYHYWTGGSSDHGHAAVGLGGRRIVSTDMTDSGPRYGRIGECDITMPRVHWGLTYAGYALVEGNGYTLIDPPEVQEDQFAMTTTSEVVKAVVPALITAMKADDDLLHKIAQAVLDEDYVPNGGALTANPDNENVAPKTAIHQLGDKSNRIEAKVDALTAAVEALGAAPFPDPAPPAPGA